MNNILGLFPKANEIAIFIYAGALFFFVLFTAMNLIELKTEHIAAFGFILILLLFRYFHEIRFGGLSMKREIGKVDEEFEAFKTSITEKIIELEQDFQRVKTGYFEEFENVDERIISFNETIHSMKSILSNIGKSLNSNTVKSNRRKTK